MFEPAVADIVSTVAATPCTDVEHHFRHFEDGQLREITLAELDRRATRVSDRLAALGVGPRDRVGIVSTNRIEWVLLDLAVIKLGAIVAGIEPGRSDPAQLVGDFGLRLLFGEGLHDNGALRDIAAVGEWALDPSTGVTARPPWTYDPADIFAIKQTSGSTGVPKGIEATAVSVNRSLSAVQEMFGHGPQDNLLVFLPIRYLQQRYWLYSALFYGHDFTLADRGTVFDVARATMPTVVMGVPGFYEQLKRRLELGGGSADLPGRRAAIQAELGGRVRYLWTGSAPASRTVLEFFNDAGVPLYEGYGLNETCIVSKNHPGNVRVGSVGKVLPHKQVRFDRDGVLIVGTAYPVNTRYTWCAPGASERVYLPTGEVKTYDVGHVDEDGFLYIDGRVDDIVTLSSALNILLPPVEERMRELPQVLDCVLYGDGKPFLTAIVSVSDPEVEGDEHHDLAAAIAELNTELRYEQRIYAAIVTAEPFTIENGLLNGQFKIMRLEFARRYAAELEQLYRTHDVYNDGTIDGAPILVLSSRTLMNR